MATEAFKSGVESRFQTLRAIAKERETPDVLSSVSVSRIEELIRARLAESLRDGVVAAAIEDVVELTRSEFERPVLTSIALAADRSDYQSWCAATLVNMICEMRLFDRIVPDRWNEVVEIELLRALVRIEVNFDETSTAGLERLELERLERRLRAEYAEKFGLPVEESKERERPRREKRSSRSEVGGEPPPPLGASAGDAVEGLGSAPAVNAGEDRSVIEAAAPEAAVVATTAAVTGNGSERPSWKDRRLAAQVSSSDATATPSAAVVDDWDRIIGNGEAPPMASPVPSKAPSRGGPVSAGLDVIQSVQLSADFEFDASRVTPAGRSTFSAPGSKGAATITYTSGRTVRVNMTSRVFTRDVIEAISEAARALRV